MSESFDSTKMEKTQHVRIQSLWDLYHQFKMREGDRKIEIKSIFTYVQSGFHTNF
jgi:hypothetical protein